MSIPHFRAASAATALALASLLAACNSATDKPTAEAATTPAAPPSVAAAPATEGTATPAQLMADHQQLVTDYRAMTSADSVMMADHQHALAAAKSAGIDNTPAFQELKKRHDALMTQLQQSIAHRQAIMDRQIALANGKMTAAQLAQENAAIKADDQKIQQEHQQLVTEHAAMMAQHQALLKKNGKA